MDTTTPYVHLDPSEVDCRECDAPAGVDCHLSLYGRPYFYSGYHDARHEVADLHVVEAWGTVPDSDIIVGECTDCGAVVDR